MAKNALPIPTSGGLVPKLLGILVTLAVLALIVQHPADAADWVTRIAGLLGAVVDGLATFLRGLAG